ncbi:hypothetical protein CIG75_03980 [Tumebacillus algifaecis]|uniref:DUF4362 domain-containing protein n=1 Tax=Tumebacillus algifaecis TaxID=1214604 RepID=A0A223CYH9_9BACL|nr:DUF4362 domain-containing protein [Tumebacillus algifaecis]ASS74224.1 hypothetical protein CIG75_03980 [Tumebacillus algifaecis]
MNMRKFLVLFCFLMLATGCSSTQQYSSETAIQNGDVISEGPKTGNLDKFYKFLSDMESQQPSDVKITRYTKEGDPIFFTMQYDGKKIKVFIDSSKDKFGGGTQTFQCLSIEKDEHAYETEYSLTGCDISSPLNILIVEKK